LRGHDCPFGHPPQSGTTRWGHERRSIRLDRLRRVFQIVRGWEDYHLYEFRIGRDLAYGVPDPNWDFPGSSPRSANKTTLARPLAQTRNKTFKCVYDFGDDSRHTVNLEVLAAAEPRTINPRLLSAKGRCPPEDVGGPSGYAEYLEAMVDPKHERQQKWSSGAAPTSIPTPLTRPLSKKRARSARVAAQKPKSTQVYRRQPAPTVHPAVASGASSVNDCQAGPLSG
jgi:hypothetical protein